MKTGSKTLLLVLVGLSKLLASKQCLKYSYAATTPTSFSYQYAFYSHLMYLVTISKDLILRENASTCCLVWQQCFFCGKAKLSPQPEVNCGGRYKLYTSLWELHATECKLHDRILALDCLAIFAVLCFRVRQNVVLAKQGKWKASRKTCTNATCEVDVVKNKRQIQTWDLW